ncbi:MAG: O-methyltransferase [Bacteroidales bacterium]|nr:O-methyltransferase [Bacteroidales bacterium]MDE7073137.1 O-methyltransferase [Bacteroidales bacterium]
MDGDFALLPEDLMAYAEAHTSPAGSFLQALERDTYVNVLCPRMISGAYQGKLLEMLCRMIKPRKVLEVGTYTGYSAICMAQVLPEGGQVFTVEHNEELQDRILKAFEQAELSQKITLLMGEAERILPGLPAGTFDLVFLDADKSNYSEYYPLLKTLLVPGGWMVADNVLWNGKVYDPACRDRDTLAVRAFNKTVQEDPDMENLLLPVRDGLMLMRKR